jgi:hypothetical protein
MVTHFANPNFKSLYAEVVPKEEGGEDIFFFNSGPNNQNNIFVVDEKGNPKKISFTETKILQGASVLLIPDKYQFSYTPEQEYIVLHHSQNYNCTLDGNALRKIQQTERIDSLYFHVLKFIGNNEGIIFSEFIKEHVTWIDPKIIVMINYLYECRNEKTILGYELLSQNGFDTDFLKGKTFHEDFTDIRNYLLGQCNFELINS